MRTYPSSARPRSESRSEASKLDRARRVTLVWIDAREAIIGRWSAGAAVLTRLGSDVPARHRSTGHVRHRPDVRHGGGSVSQSALERRRLEHLTRFIDEAARHVPDDEDVIILGPGDVRIRLARQLILSDGQHRIDRTVSVEPARRLSERQLIARLRILHGETPPRQKIEGYPWSG